MIERTALLTGANGQDGSYLSELLLEKGYRVYGLVRRHSYAGLGNLSSCLSNPNFVLVNGDVTDPTSLISIISQVQPDEIYNLAAMSFVGESWNQPRLTNEVNYLGFLNLLEAVRGLGPEYQKHMRIYQASSSEMYGNQLPPQNEETLMIPRSPYGVSKLAAHRLANVYRESFGMFVASGICFNHESPRRGVEFVTRKIAKSVAAIKRGEISHIHLGTVAASRDWGFAGDYVRAMWMMLQVNEPQDFVIATGYASTVGQFMTAAVKVAGLPEPPEAYVIEEVSQRRPAEIWTLVGDPSKISNRLGWHAECGFEELVRIMVEAEL